jgi:tetratricopeptide (TPR) repeat protein
VAGWRYPGGVGTAGARHGPGGQGKTRLADEFAIGSRTAGWTVARARHRSEVASAGGPDESLAVRYPGLVLVVDYAERWPLPDLITLVRQHQRVARDKLRILLLARPAGDWWQLLAHQFTKLDILDRAAVRLAGLPDEPQVRAGIYTSARDTFAAVLRLADPAALRPPDVLASAEFGLTLTVHMKALVDVDAARSGREPPSGRDLAGLSSYLLDREHDHWRSVHDEGRGPVRTEAAIMRRAVYLATLTRPLPPQRAASALTRTAAVDEDRAGQVLADHARCYPPQEDGLLFEPLLPDRLAEDFLALTLPGQEDRLEYHATDDWAVTAPAWLLTYPVDGPAPDWTPQVLTVLIEAAHRWPHLRNRQLTPLLLHRPGLAVAAGGVALLRLAELDGAMPPEMLLIEPHLPTTRHPDLDLGVAAVVERLVRHWLAGGEPPTSRAGMLEHLAWRYRNAGRHEDALAAIREAVELRRQLAEDDPATAPELANSLNTLAAVLHQTGQVEDALPVAEEAVAVYHRLRESDPDAFTSNYAMAVNNLGTALLHLGRAADSVAPGREAVRAVRALLPTDPDQYRPRLVATLMNLGNALAESGQAEDGLTTTRQALELLRELAAADPDAHQHDLSQTLLNYGWRLAQNDQLAEALAITTESVACDRALAAVNPIGYRPALARSLNNLGNLYARLLRPEDALTATREALLIWRELAEQNPTADRHWLAKSLTNLSIRLSQVDDGDAGEAIAAATEALDIFGALAEHNPAHLPDLDTTLDMLARWYNGTG